MPPQVAATARASGCGKPGAAGEARHHVVQPRPREDRHPVPLPPRRERRPGSRGRRARHRAARRSASSASLVSCRQTTSGRRSSSQASNRGRRCLTRVDVPGGDAHAVQRYPRPRRVKYSFRHDARRSAPGRPGPAAAGQDRPRSRAPRGRAVRLQRGHRQPLQPRRARAATTCFLLNPLRAALVGADRAPTCWSSTATATSSTARASAETTAFMIHRGAHRARARRRAACSTPTCRTRPRSRRPRAASTRRSARTAMSFHGRVVDARLRRARRRRRRGRADRHGGPRRRHQRGDAREPRRARDRQRRGRRLARSCTSWSAPARCRCWRSPPGRS